MVNEFLSKYNKTKESDLDYKPVFFNLSNNEEQEKFEKLLRDNESIQVFDELYAQLEELIKLENPTRRLTAEETSEAIERRLGGDSIDRYGVWVFYPWSNRLVHILDRDEFISIRTNRNHYKITPGEQKILSAKKVGVIGLSVGQSVALTLSMERSYGELRLADFDVLDASNMNRIRSGAHNIRIKKTVIAARDIAEIDPYLKVTCYHEGITDKNIEQYFTEGGQLDALIEECDNLYVKIKSRELAKKFGIPVIMDTSDRGMIDVERFDLDPKRPIFHGLLDGFDLSDLHTLSPERKMEIIFAILDKEKISNKFRQSIEAIGKTLTTWPQLASAVIAGGANAADTYRRIMLGEFKSSGRYYIDLDQLIK